MILEVEIVRVFLLVFMRFIGLIVAAPILGSNNFPVVGKIILALFSSVILTPTVTAMHHPLPSEPLEFALMASGELLIGLLIGVVFIIVFAAIQVAGQIMDMQSGFGMMNVFNPALETQFPIIGFFFFILAVLYLLITNGHHMMIRALVSSFDRVPLGGFAPHADLMWVFASWGTMMFTDALLIAAPVVGAMLLAYMTMGLMGRVVPQIHLFVVGFPLTIATTLFIVAFATGVYLNFLDGMFLHMFKNIDTLIDGMS